MPILEAGMIETVAADDEILEGATIVPLAGHTVGQICRSLRLMDLTFYSAATPCIHRSRFPIPNGPAFCASIQPPP